MAGKSLFKIPHSCGSSDGLQVFEEEDGVISGYCFACKTPVSNPLGDHSLEDFPVKKRIKRSPEEIREEMREIDSFPTMDRDWETIPRDYSIFFLKDL